MIYYSQYKRKTKIIYMFFIDSENVGCFAWHNFWPLFLSGRALFSALSRVGLFAVLLHTNNLNCKCFFAILTERNLIAAVCVSLAFDDNKNIVNMFPFFSPVQMYFEWAHTYRHIHMHKYSCSYTM